MTWNNYSIFQLLICDQLKTFHQLSCYLVAENVHCMKLGMLCQNFYDITSKKFTLAVKSETTIFLNFNEMQQNIPTCRIVLDLTEYFMIIYQGDVPPSPPFATEFHLGKCYSDTYDKGLFVETGQVISAFRAKET